MATEVLTKRPTRKGCPNYPIEFKRRLAAMSCMPGVSVAKLALEHQLNANMLFKWRRHYRAGKFGMPERKHIIAPTKANQSESRAIPAKLLPVIETLTEEQGDATKDGMIEVRFAHATVRLHGEVDSIRLRVVLDCLARQP